ncbi:hypothetical protein ZWY2020_050680 [Hordeum vulgare]|nr:hypothetical protein ZWY2020_050680 [Hordeum vulgare]
MFLCNAACSATAYRHGGAGAVRPRRAPRRAAQLRPSGCGGSRLVCHPRARGWGPSVVLWNMTRGFLRAYVKNGIRHLNNGVSVAGINDDILRLRQLPFRLIHFVWPGEGVDVHAPLIDHGFFLFVGRSVFRLRIRLARRLDVDIANLVMCLRTGANLLTPLLVDLPTNHDLSTSSSSSRDAW